MKSGEAMDHTKYPGLHWSPGSGTYVDW